MYDVILRGGEAGARDLTNGSKFSCRGSRVEQAALLFHRMDTCAVGLRHCIGVSRCRRVPHRGFATVQDDIVEESATGR